VVSPASLAPLTLATYHVCRPTHRRFLTSTEHNAPRSTCWPTCPSTCKFRGVDIGAPGGDSQPARWLGVLTSIADRRITPRRARVPAVSAPSSIRRAAPRVQYHGVGDDAFPLSPYVLKRFPAGVALTGLQECVCSIATIAEPSYCDTFAGAVPGTNSCAGRGSSSSACSANSNVNGQSLVLRRWLTWFYSPI